MLTARPAKSRHPRKKASASAREVTRSKPPPTATRPRQSELCARDACQFRLELESTRQPRATTPQPARPFAAAVKWSAPRRRPRQPDRPSRRCTPRRGRPSSSRQPFLRHHREREVTLNDCLTGGDETVQIARPRPTDTPQRHWLSGFRAHPEATNRRGRARRRSRHSLQARPPNPPIP